MECLIQCKQIHLLIILECLHNINLCHLMARSHQETCNQARILLKVLEDHHIYHQATLVLILACTCHMEAIILTCQDLLKVWVILHQ